VDLQARVLIVDDEPLARDRIREMLKNDRDVRIVAEARNGSEAIEAITSHQPDIVFLDVQMPDRDGFEVLKALPAKSMPLVIFVTAFDQHAIRAFDVHAIDYLLKPFDRKRFARALARAKAQLRRTNEPDTERILKLLEELKEEAGYVERFSIRNGETVLFVRADDIDSIEAEGNYVRLNLADASHLLRDTLSSVESQIDPRTFVRIHRRTIVNMNRVKELQIWARGESRVVLHGGATYTLSRGYREHFENFVKKKRVC
jgi:two-component system LytT family response regulator